MAEGYPLIPGFQVGVDEAQARTAREMQLKAFRCERAEQALHAAREVLAAEGEPEGLMLEALQVIDKALGTDA